MQTRGADNFLRAKFSQIELFSVFVGLDRPQYKPQTSMPQISHVKFSYLFKLKPQNYKYTIYSIIFQGDPV